MYYNKTTSRYVLIGTVKGGGYDCKTDKVKSSEGLWNKVSAHIWIGYRRLWRGWEKRYARLPVDN